MGATKYHSGRLGYRHGLAVVWFFGALFQQATRVGLSVAMVDMVQPLTATSRNVSGVNESVFVECPENRLRHNLSNSSMLYENRSDDEKFDWDSKAQGMLHGAFYYGYLVSQVPGAWLSHRFGTTRPVTICSLVVGVVTILSPLAARTGMWLFFFARLVVGLATGLAMPAGMIFWGQWSPPHERGRLMGGASSGAQLGTVLGMSLSGMLASYFGWESIFYCFGGLFILWVFPWVFLARDSPRQHPRISAEEKAYIIASTGKTTIALDQDTRHTIPWKAIFQTVPFYAVLIVDWGHNWGFYTLLTNLPTYLSNVQHFSLKKNGFLSALPYLVRWGGMVAVVTVADWIRTKNLLSATTTRKLFSCTSFLLGSAALVGLGFAGCDSTTAVALLVTAVGLSSLIFGGHFIAYLEMSPEFGGIIAAIGNTFGTITGIIAPLVAGYLTSGPNGQTIENWRIIFLIAAGTYVFIAVVYLFFGSAKQQPWDPTGRRLQTHILEEDERVEPLLEKRSFPSSSLG